MIRIGWGAPKLLIGAMTLSLCGAAPGMASGASSQPSGIVSTWRNVDPGSAANGHLLTTTAIAVAPSGDVYELDPVEGRVLVRSALGAFKTSWSLGGRLDQGADLAVDHLGRVFVTDPAADLVRIFAFTGSQLGEWGMGFGGLTFSHPTAVSVSPGGAIAIRDATGVRVVATNGAPEGSVRVTSGTGLAVGHTSIFDLLFDSNPTVRRFARTGPFLSSWTIFRPPDGRSGESPRLDGVDTDSAGRVWVANSDSSSIVAYGVTGRPRVTCDGKPGDRSPESARDVAVQSPSSVFVTTGRTTVHLGSPGIRGRSVCRPPALLRLAVTAARAGAIHLVATTSVNSYLYVGFGRTARTRTCQSAAALRAPVQACYVETTAPKPIVSLAGGRATRLKLRHRFASAGRRELMLAYLRDGLGRRSQEFIVRHLRPVP